MTIQGALAVACMNAQPMRSVRMMFAYYSRRMLLQ